MLPRYSTRIFKNCRSWSHRPLMFVGRVQLLSDVQLKTTARMWFYSGQPTSANNWCHCCCRLLSVAVFCVCCVGVLLIPLHSCCRKHTGGIPWHAKVSWAGGCFSVHFWGWWWSRCFNDCFTWSWGVFLRTIFVASHQVTLYGYSSAVVCVHANEYHAVSVAHTLKEFTLSTLAINFPSPPVLPQKCTSSPVADPPVPIQMACQLWWTQLQGRWCQLEDNCRCWGDKGGED